MKDLLWIKSLEIIIATNLVHETNFFDIGNFYTKPPRQTFKDVLEQIEKMHQYMALLLSMKALSVTYYHLQ